MREAQLSNVGGGRAAWIEPLRRRVETFVWERRLAIATRSAGGMQSQEHVGYGTIPYQLIFMVLDRLGLGPQDVFVDLGCGRGRVLCCTARRRVIYGKAQDFDYTGVTAIYMYHPFGPHTLDQVLSRLKSSLAHGSEMEKLRLAYVNPVHESVIAALGWWERYDYWPPERLPERKRSVSFWRPNTSIGNGLPAWRAVEQ